MPNVEIDGTNSTVKTNVLTSQSGTTITVPTGKVLTVTDAAGLTVAGNAPLTSIANDSVDSQHYAAGSIDEEHIAADAVNFATHLKAGTDGELITWDASGNPAAVAVGTSGHVLTSGGAGVAPTFVAAAGGGKLLQVVTHTTNSVVSVGGTAALTGSAATLVTSAANSKILCLVFLNGIMKHTSSNTNTGQIIFLKKDNSTVQYIAQYLGYNFGGTNTRFSTISSSYITPTIGSSSTSVLFNTWAVTQIGGGNIAYQTNAEVSTMVLMELGA